MTTSLDSLRDTARQLRELEETQTTQVIELRAAGASWAAIGRCLGISRQGAQKKFAHLRPNIEDLPLSDPIFDPLFLQAER